MFEVSRILQGNFKDVSGKIQGYFKKGSRVFQLRLNGVLSIFKGVSRVFVRSLKGVSGKFKWCYNAVSRGFK